MTGPRAPIPADPADHPLRAALARGDRLAARSAPALHHLLAAEDRRLLDEAIVAQVGGMIADIADQLGDGKAPDFKDHLLALEPLRAHCHALALEWRLALRLESDRALDPVLSPVLQALVAAQELGTAPLAMAALSAQARFAQAQRRMQLPLNELPAEIFHATLLTARQTLPEGFEKRERDLREEFDEGTGRLALLARLASEGTDAKLLAIDEAGVALWLSALARQAGESRERTAGAAANPQLGRLLLTLRAAGLAPSEAERQALLVEPDATLPRGLHDIGTREAAQWLAEAQV
jgi:hypothetical protein